MNTINTGILLSIIAILGLSGCVEPKIPVGEGNQGVGVTSCEIAQVFDVYAKLANKTVGTTESIDLGKHFLLKQTRPVTRAEAVKLIEQELRDQAGIVVIHRDRKHVVFGLAADSSQPLPKTNGCNQDWLNDDHFTNAVAKEVAIISNQSLRLDHQKTMVALQDHADILLKLVNVDPEQLKVLHSNVTNLRQNAIFDVAKLNELMINAKDGKPIASAVIILPIIYLGRTPENELMRQIDGVLCNAGVKQRVFESRTDGGFWLGLQSPSD